MGTILKTAETRPEQTAALAAAQSIIPEFDRAVRELGLVEPTIDELVEAVLRRALEGGLDGRNEKVELDNGHFSWFVSGPQKLVEGRRIYGEKEAGTYLKFWTADTSVLSGGFSVTVQRRFTAKEKRVYEGLGWHVSG